VRAVNTAHLSVARAFLPLPRGLLPGNMDESEPVRQIYDHKDLAEFLESSAFQDIWDFVERLNCSVRGLSGDALAGPRVPATSLVTAELAALKELAAEVELLPAETGRFGNRAFRTWFSQLQERTPRFTEELLVKSDQTKRYGPDLQAYFLGAFGDPMRIDYGTGHEASFLLFMFCLHRLHLFRAEDFPELVLSVFPAYLATTRYLQQRFTLEPAGSHGVWGLDDYVFLPFLFGSSQLIGKDTEVPPVAARDRELVLELAPKYLYFDTIRFILETKRGPFAEHSPTLYDISGLENWSRINAGLLRMYKAEVWSKLPVIQHIPFGILIPFRSAARTSTERLPAGS